MNNCNDLWNGKDKVWHFGVCFVLACICPALGVIAVIAKEAYDMKQNGNHWCWKDVVADAAEIVIRQLCILALYRLHDENITIKD